MTVALGAALISPANPAWPTQIQRLALMRPSLVKVQFTPGFGTTPAHVTQMLDALPSVKVLVLRGEDGDPTYERNKRELLPWLDVLRRPGLRVVIELGNEPDRVKPTPSNITWYRDQGLNTIRLLRAELREQHGIDGLEWSLSLPTTLPDVERLFASGAYERDCTCICTHLYGFWHLLDEGVPTDWEHIWHWLLANTSRPLWITEAGIDDSATPLTEKARRYLAFLNDAPERLRGLALWAPVSTAAAGYENFMLDDAALAVLGARDETAMVTPDTVVVGVDPRDISQAKFLTVQQAASSPAAGAGSQSYHELLEHPVSIAFQLAIFHHESQYGKLGICFDHSTKSPGNTRSTRTGIGEVLQIPGRGPFVRYPNWPEGWRDLAFRLVDPSYVYVKEGRRTIRQIITRFAPEEDNNVPEAYIAAVVRDMNAWREQEPPVALTDLIRDRIAAHGVEVHDIRNVMVTNGQYEQRPNSAWVNTAVHHTAANRPPGSLASERQSWINHSVFHVSGRGWPGIAYAIGISMSGRVFILRDIEEMGFHAFSANSNSLAVCGDMTTGQTPTQPELDAMEMASAPLPEALNPYELAPEDYAPASPGMLRSLEVVLTVLHNETPELPNLTHATTYGHQELAFIDGQNAGTACPGSLLPFVRRYRAEGSSIENGDEPMPPERPETITQEGNPNGPIPIVRGFADTFWGQGWQKYKEGPMAGALSMFGWAETSEGWVKDDDGNNLYVEQRFEKRRLRWHPNLAPPFDIQDVRLEEIMAEPGDGIDPDAVAARMAEIVAEVDGGLDDWLAATAKIGRMRDRLAKAGELASKPFESVGDS